MVHFDLKCDNILLEALPGVPEEKFWAPTSDVPPFKVVLADFGDSCDFSLSESKFTTRQADCHNVWSPVNGLRNLFQPNHHVCSTISVRACIA